MRRLLNRTRTAIGLPILVALATSCADTAPTRPDALMVRSAAGIVNAVGPKLVISQIYGGGGNSGATLTHDYIELFNAGDAPITFANWSVQYASSTGSSWGVTPISGTVPPGGYFLVQQAKGTGGTQALPTPDATGTSMMSATTGKVALRTSTAQLSGTCPVADAVEIVGFGNSNCGTTSALSNTTALLRNEHGCAATFSVGAPAPRNSASPAHPCQPQAEVDRVTVTPESAILVVGNTRQFSAAAFDAAGNPVAAAFSWSTSPASGIISVDGTGLVRAVGEGDAVLRVSTANGKFAEASIHVDEAPLPNLPATRFSEIHYDNVGTDVGEFIEVEGPAATDLTGWSVVLYNGSGGTVYDVRQLAGTIPVMCGSRGVVVVSYEQDGIQNGAPDGMALVDAAGTVVEFLSYEGVVTAADGPAAGMTSVNIGASQNSAAHFQTLQRRPSGIWEGPKASTRGGCYGSTPVTPVNQVSFSGRSPFDAPLPVGFEDQLFADLRAPNNATLPTTITWTSLTPSIASIDARGVIHALAPGTATFRATASEGTTATFSLPMAVATASTTARYGNHAEFGEPSDADPGDDYILRRTEFTSSFNRTTNIPNWVAYNLEATHIQSGQDRCDCFTYDPLLPAEFARYTTADYTGAGAAAGYGIDRGHLARSFDRTSGSLDNARTFYFSNIIPQAADNNQGPWANFENHLGSLAQNQNRELYIVTGASGNKGTVKNEGLITIPTHVWKVAVIMPRDHGLPNVDSYDDVEVIAVVVPNEPGIRTVDWNTYRTTVNAVEQLSGYDVLALLPDDVEALLETGLFEAQAVVDGLATAGTLDAGAAQSLSAKLAAAGQAIERGSASAAAGQLRAFTNEVNAMERSRRLGATDANTLRAAVEKVASAL